jgi:predicted metal-dependent hydrolase
MEYDLIRSARKSITIFVREGGRIEVRAPYRTSIETIEDFLRKKSVWIHRTQAKVCEEDAGREVLCLSAGEVRARARQLEAYLAERAPLFARSLGVCYGRIRVGRARRRWASCTAGGDLNFTYRMAFLPPELADYIIVHELSHRKEMNHSPDFWRVVESVMPDYRERRKALRAFSKNRRFTEAESGDSVNRKGNRDAEE